jgi:hypothetical protein
MVPIRGNQAENDVGEKMRGKIFLDPEWMRIGATNGRFRCPKFLPYTISTDYLGGWNFLLSGFCVAQRKKTTA